MAQYINWRRLVAGAAVLSLLLLPLWFLREESDRSILPAALLDTPAGGASAAGVGLEEGRLAPNFELSGPDGSRLRLADLRGRAVLINFWATWCGSCLSEMPAIRALHEQRGAAAFHVLAINAGETKVKAQAFIDFLDAPFLYGLDIDMRVTDAYGVYGLPLSVFIDAGGVIRAVYRGHANEALLARFVDAAINAEPPGPVAPVLRIVSTIPRERILSVRSEGSTLVVASRSLRCDPSYCAAAAIEAFRDVALSLRAEVRDAGEGELSIRLESGAAPEPAVTALVTALQTLPDPLYEGPIQVRYQ